MERKINRTAGAAGGGKTCSRWKLYASAIVAFVSAIIIMAVVLNLTKEDDEIFGIPQPDRIECPGFKDEDCESSYCMLDKVRHGPSCYMEKNTFGYMTGKVTEDDNGTSITLKRMTINTPYGESLKNVVFKLTYLTANIVRFQFKTEDTDRYEVPVQKEFPLLKDPPEGKTENLTYEFSHTNETEIFSFAIKRKDNKAYLWDSRIGALLLSEQFLQIGSFLPSKNVYGLGEHVHDTLRHDLNFSSWPMFSRDEPPKVPSDGKNLYSVHPFYTCLEYSGKSHGVLFLNSNAMEVTFVPSPGVSFRTIGGILDFFIFVGDNPEHVIELYTSLVGRPMIPPHWGLGFQLSRYGYQRIVELEKVVDRNLKIPQSVQYLDIDHLYKAKVFTYDNETYRGLPEFINKTKEEQGLKWIVVVDPGIAAVKEYEPYQSGIDKSVFVRRAEFWNPSMYPEFLSDQEFVFGKVWPPSFVAFPDFFKNSTKDWWKEQIKKYHETISFDGLWLDMNEPANFGTDEGTPEYCEYERNKEEAKECFGVKCPTSGFEDPPYNPLKSRLSKKTICMESVQGEDKELTHYNIHSLYGWSETSSTLEAAQEATGTRSLVISRSTYPSSGKWGGHWLGDNDASYNDMKKSVIGIMEFNLFGIPYVGADVCGFFGDSTDDLCKRWMQLGAFYPFYRNHNALHTLDQDPGFYEVDVVDVMRKAIERRIKLNPYLYTLFYRAHVDGSTVVRPVFHEFPYDTITWDMGTQFMWGKSLMVVPNLEENMKSLTLYLPKDEWWIFNEEKSLRKRFTQRYTIELDADEYTPVYVRGGTVLPYGTYERTNKTEDVMPKNISLYIFPKDGEASGELFVDDGVSIDTVENNAFALYDFQYTNCSLKITSDKKSDFKGESPTLETVVVFDVKENITKVDEDYEFTMVEEYHCAVITVGKDMKSVTEIKWEGSC